MAAEAASPVVALMPAITLLGVGAAAALASKALKLSPIVGYLIAGVVIGPHVIGIEFDEDATHLLAELGVVFLLFDIGMHVSLRELKESRRDLIGLAPAHLIVCSILFSLLLGLAGASPPIAIAIGVSLGLSSTAVVSRILTERSLASCPLGRSATHVLIFQDIVAIFLLIFAHGLAGDPSALLSSMGWASVQAVIAFAAAILAGQYVISPAFKALAATRNDEAFTAFTLLLVLGAAAATAMMGLSLTLGAFLAGLAVSGTPYRHQIQTETGPFRGLLLSFFFISVGLMLDVPALLTAWPYVIGSAAVIMLAKTAGGYLAARLNKWTVPGATQLAFLLAQGSEFTLVVLAIGAVTAGLPNGVEAVLVAAVALTLAIAPSWAGLGMQLSRKLAERQKDQDAAPMSSDTGTARPVIVFGMTASGRLAVDALLDNDIPVVALDSEPDRFLAAVADGYKVTFGDAANLKLITAIGANHARAVVIGAPRYEVSKSITPAIERNFPGMHRFVAVDSPEDLKRFEALGMRAHLSLAEPKGLEMAVDLLREMGVDREKLSEWITLESDRFDVEDATDNLLDPEPEAEAA
ncbi:MAG: cation:proton antiporter [Pseudomonadota bacterium]